MHSFCPFRRLVSFFPVASLFLLLLTLSACTSFSTDDLQSLSENDLFNKAQRTQQSAVTKTEYKNTIQMYQYYIDRFNQRPDRVMEARYEIGYIHYFLGQYEAAEALFRTLIHEYDTGADAYTPQWIYVLSNQLKDKIVKLRSDRIVAESKKKSK